jgi:enoyl-CoA hydratase
VEELDGLASDPALSRYAGPLVRGYKAIFDQMTALPKVIIAAMNGDAMGGGFELTLACDLRIGQRGDFRYGNPEVRAGVIPGAGGTQRVTRPSAWRARSTGCCGAASSGPRSRLSSASCTNS